MKRLFLAAIGVQSCLLFFSAVAGAQEFMNVGGLAESLAGIRAQTAGQRAQDQKPPRRAMGGERSASEPSFQAESLPPDGGISGAAASAAPDVARYQVKGVDISHYEGSIAWDKVRLEGLSFVYIKATEGGDGVDEQFANNWRGVSSVGLLKGAYHFYNFCKGGAVQADNFIKTVPLEAGVLPMTVDLEQSGDCKVMPQKAAFRKELAAFIRKVKKAYGHDPVLYINASIYDKYLLGENDPYKLWIADVKHAAPVLSDNAPWAMWQYGWHGSVAGIPGEVDLDVFNGTPQMLAGLAGAPADVMVASLIP
jgi:lysozyme